MCTDIVGAWFIARNQLSASEAASSDVHGSMSNMDKTAPPVTIFQYANGGWVAKIPCLGVRSLGIVRGTRQKNQTVLKDTSKQPLKTITPSPGALNKGRRLLCGCMDLTKIEAAGIKPLETEFQKSVHSTMQAHCRIRLRECTTSVSSRLCCWCCPDFKKSTDVIAQAVQVDSHFLIETTTQGRRPVETDPGRVQETRREDV